MQTTQPILGVSDKTVATQRPHYEWLITNHKVHRSIPRSRLQGAQSSEPIAKHGHHTPKTRGSITSWKTLLQHFLHPMLHNPDKMTTWRQTKVLAHLPLSNKKNRIIHFYCQSFFGQRSRNNATLRTVGQWHDNRIMATQSLFYGLTPRIHKMRSRQLSSEL